MQEWKNSRKAARQNGRMAEWQNGGTSECKSSRMAEWQNGRTAGFQIKSSASPDLQDKLLYSSSPIFYAVTTDSPLRIHIYTCMMEDEHNPKSTANGSTADTTGTKKVAL